MTKASSGAKEVPGILRKPMSRRRSISEQAELRWIALLAYYEINRESLHWRQLLILALAQDHWPGFKLIAEDTGAPSTVVKDPERLFLLTYSILTGNPLHEDQELMKAVMKYLSDNGARPLVNPICRALAVIDKSPWKVVNRWKEVDS